MKHHSVCAADLLKLVWACVRFGPNYDAVRNALRLMSIIRSKHSASSCHWGLLLPQALFMSCGSCSHQNRSTFSTAPGCRSPIPRYAAPAHRVNASSGDDEVPFYRVSKRLSRAFPKITPHNLKPL